jgi:ACS family hexuronate transporter-like MFS transporter
MAQWRSDPEHAMTTKIKGLRWYIAGVLCLATALNYLDRQTLALLAHTLEKELGITTVQYSYIVATFLTSYTIMYAVGGRLIDYLGTRRGFAFFVSFWSAADLLHAFARTVLQFSFCRFLLGAAEPVNFPAAVKAVSEWFPMRERALAVGIFNSGTAIGAGLAAPLVAWITLNLGWRYTFVAGAALSMCWVVLWLSAYRLPRQHPRICAEELALIEEDAQPRAEGETVPLGHILRIREAWGCILARLLTDPISYFFAFWMPQFLQRERGFNLADIGRYFWIPYLALAVGNIAGGEIPRRLIQRGWSVNRSRKMVMFAASIVMPTCFILITCVASPVWAVALISAAMFSHAAWGNMTLPAEIFPKHVVGTVAGLGGAAGSMVGAVAMLLIGRTIVVTSFTPIFIIYSIVPMTAFAVVCILIKKLGQVREVAVS